MGSQTNRALLGLMHRFSDGVRDNYSADPRHYLYGAVKRGLRNADGTGVLAGVTGIGSVQGYMMLDGEPIPMPGRLYYRGIDVREIVDAHIEEERTGYEEVAALLLLGALPDQGKLDAFCQALALCRTLPQGFEQDILAVSPSGSVMNILSRAVLALHAYDPCADDNSLENMVRQSLELIARVPVIACHAYAFKRHALDGEPLQLVEPQDRLCLAENILHMLCPQGGWTRQEARLLDLLLTILAEHGGGTPSTFACRALTSAGTDVYGAVSAAINVVKGRMDGGTALAALNMYENIKGHVSRMDDDRALAEYLGLILDGEANDGSGCLYGLGHAVYTQSDPRTLLLKQAAADLADKKGFAEELRLMDNIERVGIQVLTHRRALSKLVCANVDLYTGLVLRMLGIPDEMFEPLFCVAHIASWCAHRIEEKLSGSPMMRPAYRSAVQYAPYVPLSQRG